jgi:threonine synthase
VAPAASGSLITKIWKGLKELKLVGLLNELNTRVYGAQAEGCSPIAQAWREGRDYIKPVKPNTIAKSIAIGNPADGIYALQVTKESRGDWETATDEEIIEGIKLLAETEGIFTETAGGTTIAVLKKLAERGAFKEDEVVVAYITGNGCPKTSSQASIAPPLTPFFYLLKCLPDLPLSLCPLKVGLL